MDEEEIIDAALAEKRAKRYPFVKRYRIKPEQLFAYYGIEDSLVQNLANESVAAKRRSSVNLSKAVAISQSYRQSPKLSQAEASVHISESVLAAFNETTDSIANDTLPKSRRSTNISQKTRPSGSQRNNQTNPEARLSQADPTSVFAITKSILEAFNDTAANGSENGLSQTERRRLTMASSQADPTIPFGITRSILAAFNDTTGQSLVNETLPETSADISQSVKENFENISPDRSRRITSGSSQADPTSVFAVTKSVLEAFNDTSIGNSTISDSTSQRGTPKSRRVTSGSSQADPTSVFAVTKSVLEAFNDTSIQTSTLSENKSNSTSQFGTPKSRRVTSGSSQADPTSVFAVTKSVLEAFNDTSIGNSTMSDSTSQLGSPKSRRVTSGSSQAEPTTVFAITKSILEAFDDTIAPSSVNGSENGSTQGDNVSDTRRLTTGSSQATNEFAITASVLAAFDETTIVNSTINETLSETPKSRRLTSGTNQTEPSADFGISNTILQAFNDTSISNTTTSQRLLSETQSQTPETPKSRRLTSSSIQMDASVIETKDKTIDLSCSANTTMADGRHFISEACQTLPEDEENKSIIEDSFASITNEKSLSKSLTNFVQITHVSPKNNTTIPQSSPGRYQTVNQSPQPKSPQFFRNLPRYMQPTESFLNRSPSILESPICTRKCGTPRKSIAVVRTLRNQKSLESNGKPLSFDIDQMKDLPALKRRHMATPKASRPSMALNRIQQYASPAAKLQKTFTVEPNMALGQLHEYKSPTLTFEKLPVREHVSSPVDFDCDDTSFNKTYVVDETENDVSSNEDINTDFANMSLCAEDIENTSLTPRRPLRNFDFSLAGNTTVNDSGVAMADDSTFGMVIKNKSPVYVLSKPKIIAPDEDEVGVRRSKRNRVRTLRHDLGEEPIYELDENGFQTLVGVNTVQIKDRRAQKYKTVDPIILNEREKQRKKTLKKQKEFARRMRSEES